MAGYSSDGLTTKAAAASSPCPPPPQPPHAGVVVPYCLTREEECTLKTALAFVVAKARLGGGGGGGQHRKRAALVHPHDEDEDDWGAGSSGNAGTAGISHAPSSGNRFRRRIAKRGGGWGNDAGNDNGDDDDEARPFSVLDVLFPPRPPADDGGDGVPSRSASLLHRYGGTRHLDHMFQAAVTLAKCAVLQEKDGRGRDDGPGNGSSCSNNAAALVGATGHLAHQLQLLLSTTTAPPPSAAPAAAAGGGDGGGPPGGDGTTAIQAWIRASLLLFSSAPSRPLGATGGSAAAAATDDIEAALLVYQVLVPQLAILSPPVLAHIFHAVARIVRELYDDDGPHGGHTTETLDCLAASALTLLELCWTADTAATTPAASPSPHPTEWTGSGNDSGNGSRCHDEDGHRSFLLLCLQDTLGDMLVPPSHAEMAIARLELAGRGTTTEAPLTSTPCLADLHVRRPPNVTPPAAAAVGRNDYYDDHDDCPSRSPSWNDNNPPEATTPTVRPPMDVRSSIVGQNGGGTVRTADHHHQQQQHGDSCLDPGAKLLMRMAVYRLLMLDCRKRPGRQRAPDGYEAGGARELR